MLGIGNVVTAGSKVASVVRKDLEAWYKEGETQAPLGEEKINNGRFTLGNEVLDEPGFGVNGQLTTSANPFRWYLVPGSGVHDPNYEASISNNRLTISVDGSIRDSGTGRVFGFGDGSNILIQGKSYLLTYTVASAVNASGNFYIYTGNPGYKTVEELGGLSLIHI